MGKKVNKNDRQRAVVMKRAVHLGLQTGTDFFNSSLNTTEHNIGAWC